MYVTKNVLAPHRLENLSAIINVLSYFIYLFIFAIPRGETI